MPDSVMYNPSRILSTETRSAIKALGIDLDDYAGNICSRLRMRGEYDLATAVNEEIADANDQMRRSHERSENIAAWERQQNPPSRDLCDDGDRHRWEPVGVGIARCRGCGRERH